MRCALGQCSDGAGYKNCKVTLAKLLWAMGFYIGKSVSLGPLRFVNLSKSVLLAVCRLGFELRFGSGPRGTLCSQWGRNGLYSRQHITIIPDEGTSRQTCLGMMFSMSGWHNNGPLELRRD